MAEKLSPDYWNKRYQQAGNPGWDVGYAVPALTRYFDQLTQKSIQILMPGGGFGYEAAYLFDKGFTNIFFLDYAEKAVSFFREKFPHFPENQIIQEDFFQHSGKYDLIIEHTFFYSLHPDLRKDYVRKAYDLLNEDGKLVGLFFNHQFGKEEPPFGGTAEEYINLFRNCFNFQHFSPCNCSIKPRAGRELFVVLVKKMCFNQLDERF
ncbi:MAG TPA: class I SAM-dependent methyltransferase [Bacteroidia bacterium]|nr:class I SAM-dependent methyltransferase [Bacteroidia bacterium]HRS58058.1 class I SAM-dependent methyltransferase [Bacteroidia bacterium]HRU66924.1 class I SAM-dependent methyltransferase [Bacteroidia bacterium]